MKRELHRCLRRLAQRKNVGTGNGRNISRCIEIQDFLFRIRDQTVAIHRDRVDVAQESELPGFLCRRRNLAHTQQLEGLLQKGKRIRVGNTRGRIHRTHGHLFGAAAGRDQSDTYLDLTHVSFARRPNSITVHRDLAAAAERQAIRRRYDWLRRISKAHDRLLQSSDHHVDVIPLLLLRGEQEHHQVGTGRKIATLIADDESFEILIYFVDRKVHHLNSVTADRVHLRMKLETRDTIPEIEQGSSGIRFDDAGPLFYGLENDDSGRFRDRLVTAADKIVVKLLPAFGFIKSLSPGLQHLFDIRRNWLTFFSHSLDRFANTDRVPRFEYTDLPTESPLECVIDLDDRVRDLGDAIGRVTGDPR